MRRIEPISRIAYTKSSSDKEKESEKFRQQMKKVGANGKTKKDFTQVLKQSYKLQSKQNNG